MAFKNCLQGWYSVINKSKVIAPIDEHMKSYKCNSQGVFFEYKSSLELKSFKYADSNPRIIKFSVECFAIQYIKPTDGKFHRYYIDLYLEFKEGNKFIVEIKPKSQTQPPKQPKNKTKKSLRNFKKAKETYAINIAKWEAAKEFGKKNNMIFMILTDEMLNK